MAVKVRRTTSGHALANGTIVYMQLEKVPLDLAMLVVEASAPWPPATETCAQGKRSGNEDPRKIMGPNVQARMAIA